MYESASLQKFRKIAAKQLQCRVWEQAAKYYQATGLEEGAALSVLEQHLKRLHKKGSWSQSPMLLVKAFAGCWSNVRVSQGGCEDQNILRSRCNQAPETDWHRIWDCAGDKELGKAV